MKLLNPLGGAIFAAAAMLAAPAGALAQPLGYVSQVDGAHLAYTAQAVNLRAGPDAYYPVIVVLPPGTRLMVQGCLPDYRWCDVIAGYDRGWVYADNLRYPYQYGYLSFPGIAPYISIAILSFVFHDYWDLHYRDRPWYADRDRYFRPPPPPAPAPWVHPSPPMPQVAPLNPRPWVQPPAQPPRVQPPPPRVQPPPPRVQPQPPRVQPQPPRVQPPPQQPPRVQPPPQQPPRVQSQPRVQVQPDPREETRRQQGREEEERRGRAGSEDDRPPGR